MVEGCGLDLFVWGRGRLVGPCEQDNELSDVMKVKELLD